MTIEKSAGSGAQRIARPSLPGRWLAARLRGLRRGCIRLELPDGSALVHRGDQPGPDAVLRVARWRFFWRLASEGEVGLGRSYAEGDWSSPDLGQVFAFGLANVEFLDRAVAGSALTHRLNALWHRANANTLCGSKRNIAAHYDLGNAFYGLWLDEEMNYSSGIFATDGETLGSAQARKLDRIIELLSLEGGERVLEIGCGWGALARRIAQTQASHVTGITLSTEQLAVARDRAGALPEAGKLAFDLCDYRNVEGRFDRIVSIEMFEAVGEKYWPLFFAKLHQYLEPGGSAVMQIITIADEVFPSYRRRPDFIQQYIFPGGMLPTVSSVEREAERAGFRLESYEPFGLSYALTLRHWHERFQIAWPDLRNLGFDDRFRRIWEYYLRYCEEGFRAGQIDVGLFKLAVR